MNGDDIKFVARHYRKGSFSVDRAWRQMRLTSPLWSRGKIAAAIAAFVVVCATAAVLVHRHYDLNVPAKEDAVEQQDMSPMRAVRAIDFDNAPLTAVVAEIEAVYGVGISNVPEEAESYRLTLHYQGNVCDLVDCINDILDTCLEVVQ